MEDFQEVDKYLRALVCTQVCGYAGMSEGNWVEYNRLAAELAAIGVEVVYQFSREWVEKFPRYKPGMRKESIDESGILVRNGIVAITSEPPSWMG